MDYGYRIRDPVHGFIQFTEAERTIIDHPTFQRLRDIRQLALTSLVYPGAMHTRFEHSLGVMHLATRMFKQIKENTVALQSTLWDAMVIDPLRSIDLTEDRALAVLRMAALLHDVGHLPFSHAAEAVLEGIKHEQVSVAIVQSLRDIIDRALFHGAAERVSQLINPDQRRCPSELLFLHHILSGQIDADRCDYLLRDSLHCGVAYGQFDLDRLLDSLLLVEQDGALRLAVDRGGVHAVEALILARYHMFSQVYFHKTRRVFDHYLSLVFEQHLPPFGKENILDVLEWCDSRVLNTICGLAKDRSTGEWSPALALHLRGGQQGKHSVVYETSYFAGWRDARKVSLATDELARDYVDYDLWVDGEAKGTLHRFYLPGDPDEGDEFPVVVNRRRQRLALITGESSVIRQMPKQFWVVRAYARADRSMCDRIHERIDKEVSD